MGATFGTAMTKQSAVHNAALLAAYDFAPFGLVVDVGGGNGATLAAILRAHPGVRGVLLNLPAVVADTSPLDDPAVADRCRVLGGDMLQSVPAGADCYLIKRVLSNTSDEDAVAVLSRCASALAPGGRVLVVEQDPGPRNEPNLNKILDVLFLTMFGSARMRTEAEFRALFERAGLHLVTVRRTGSPNAIFEGRGMSRPSILTRTARQPDLTVRYGPGPDHVADVWLPVDPRPAPLLLFLHGGFWRMQIDRTHTGPLAAALAAAGHAVASAEFRRVGPDGGGWPTTFDDVALAADMLPALVVGQAPGRVDRDQVVLAGHSAGGHLALWVAARHRLPRDTRWWLPNPRPVRDLAQAYRLGLGEGAVTALLGGGPADVPARYAATDPASLLPTGVPTALVHGTVDRRVPVGLARRYVAAARAVGDRVAFAELPDADHFAVIDPATSAWPAVLDGLAGLLDGSADLPCPVPPQRGRDQG